MNRMKSERSRSSSRERQSGIDRVVEILDALLRLRQPTRTGELARHIGAPRSTVYSIVNRLIEAGVLEAVSEDGQVYFGQSIHLFGQAHAEANPLHRRCRVMIERLATQANATAQLCALRGNKYVVVDSADGTGVFRITTDIGVEVPIPWTASGRLLLDHLSADEIKAFVPAEDFILPDGSTVDADRFVADVVLAKAEGRCMTNGLSDRFTCCLAAPIRNKDGLAIATICFILPVDQPHERKAKLLDMLVEAAAELSDTRQPGNAAIADMQF
ncbi:MAG: IclR family transcriptional regulator [Alphaproteobacteria bacterium]|nr:IclR family transcriptional regulator [Alphaproteobacteria bacterium]